MAQLGFNHQLFVYNLFMAISASIAQHLKANWLHKFSFLSMFLTHNKMQKHQFLLLVASL